MPATTTTGSSRCAPLPRRATCRLPISPAGLPSRSISARASASIDWGDLRGVRFAEPFFDQTVERWAGRDPAPLVRTDLEALRRARRRAVARSVCARLPPVALRLDPAVTAPRYGAGRAGRSPSRRRSMRCCWPVPTRSTRPRRRGRCACWCGRSAGAASATSGVTSSSCRAGTSAHFALFRRAFPAARGDLDAACPARDRGLAAGRSAGLVRRCGTIRARRTRPWA